VALIGNPTVDLVQVSILIIIWLKIKMEDTLQITPKGFVTPKIL
jgi:hypothetical protein